MGRVVVSLLFINRLHIGGGGLAEGEVDAIILELHNYYCIY